MLTSIAAAAFVRDAMPGWNDHNQVSRLGRLQNQALLPYPWVGQKRHIAHYGFPARSDPSAPVDLPTSVVRRIPNGAAPAACRPGWCPSRRPVSTESPRPDRRGLTQERAPAGGWGAPGLVGCRAG